jgi:hypothetical protein
VRRRDDDAEVKREQRDSRCRQHAGEDCVPARLHDTARERFLERLTRRARVPSEKDALVGVRPQRRRLAEPFEEVLGDEVADDPADAVRSEVVPSHGARAYRCGRFVRSR